MSSKFESHFLVKVRSFYNLDFNFGSVTNIATEEMRFLIANLKSIYINKDLIRKLCVIYYIINNK